MDMMSTIRYDTDDNDNNIVCNENNFLTKGQFYADIALYCVQLLCCVVVWDWFGLSWVVLGCS